MFFYYIASVSPLERGGKLSLGISNPHIPPEVSAVEFIGGTAALFGSIFFIPELGHSQSCFSYVCILSWEIKIVMWCVLLRLTREHCRAVPQQVCSYQYL